MASSTVLRERIDRHVVVDFYRVANSQYLDRFMFEFACGAVAVTKFIQETTTTATMITVLLPGCDLRYATNSHCDYCSLLRAVAQANKCAPSDAEPFL